jgi:phosphate transport system permease protein
VSTGASTRAPQRTGPGPERPVARRPAQAAHGSVPWYAPWLVLECALAVAVVLWQVTDRTLTFYVFCAIVAYTVIVYVWARLVEGKRKALDRLVTAVVVSFFAFAMVPLVSLIWTVVRNGIHRFDWAFFTSDMRNVTGEGGGGAHAIVGTIIITTLATVFAVPIGILAAIYLREYGKGWLARWLTFFVDVMTGIPSIVAGLFSFSVFAIFLGPGIRLGVMGSVALAVLMIPIVVRSTEEMLKIVPDGLREAAYALGVPKWRTIVKVVLPTALTGIVTGVMLAIARIIGETAPLLVTTGFISTMNLDPFHGRMNNLPVFSYYSYTVPGVPPEPYIDRAWTAALVLVVMVLILYVGARAIAARFSAVPERR